MKKLIISIVRVFSHLYTYRFNNWVQQKKCMLYNAWIKNFIGSIGPHSYIEKPCEFQGGGEKRIYIGDYTRIGSHTVMGCWTKHGDKVYSPFIIIGDNCNIGDYNHISAVNRISIGSGLLTGRYVTITDNSHGSLSIENSLVPPANRELESKGEVVIGNNVWIGEKVIILPGVHIGDNVIIAANSAVTHDVPSNSVIAGVPSRVINHLG